MAWRQEGGHVVMAWQWNSSRGRLHSMCATTLSLEFLAAMRCNQGFLCPSAEGHAKDHASFAGSLSRRASPWFLGGNRAD